MKRNLLLFALLAFVFASCGKYEEGPKISLASKKARLVNQWKMEKMFKNGSSVSLTSNDQEDYIEFKKDGTYEVVDFTGSISSTGTGKWSFSSDKESINTSVSYTVLGFTTTNTTTYKILRLKSDELWVKYTDVTNGEWEIHYVTK